MRHITKQLELSPAKAPTALVCVNWGRGNVRKAFGLWMLSLATAVVSALHLHAQPVSGAIGSFGVTNYSSYVLAGDTGNNGRQAIRTKTIMNYTDGNPPGQSYDFQLQYSLLDSNNSPVPILDEMGYSNIYYYSVTQTIQMPNGVTTLSRTDGAPLQPLTRLDPYQIYTPKLEVFSRPSGVGSFTDTGANATDAPGPFYDFTNSVSPDTSPNLLVTLNQPILNRNFAIAGSPNQGGFPMYVVAFVQRYDDWTLPPSAINTTVTFNFQLVDVSANGSIPLQSSQAAFNLAVQSHSSSVPPNPTYIAVSTNFQLVPTIQMDSVDDQFQIIVTLTHTEGPNLVTDYTYTNSAGQLFAFNGNLLFGSLLTHFTNLDTTTISATPDNDHVDFSLPVSLNAGWLPNAPGYTYGDSTGIPVSFFADGTAVLRQGAFVPLHSPSQAPLTIQNISYQLSGARLTSTGAVGLVTLDLPLGMSVFLPSGSGNLGQLPTRLTTNSLTFTNILLNAQLAPSNSAVVFPGRFFAIEETLPYWFAAMRLTWLVNAGQLSLDLSGPGSRFVRQLEDDLLTTNQLVLVEPSAANRISNDGYFRNAVLASATLTVTADANGVALVSAQLGLQPPELRPHFPYSGSGSGAQVEAPTGELIVQSGLVSSNSYLNFTNPVPVLYAQDCEDTNCGGGMAGWATLPFTNLANKLGFTPDGGLLAYGWVPTSYLVWGYINGFYAQEALDVSNCVYEMAGTFLRYDQSGMDPAQRPAVILLSGFGDGTNSTYVERLGDLTSYPNGFANYAGLNFRAPPLGLSYIAQQYYGTYQLTPNSKYYARWGGISGIHEALSLPMTKPQFYGYNFSFSFYRLSYLDNDVWDSRTDGQITFPKLPLGPAGFVQGFEDMVFSCHGDILSAQLPAGGGITNHLDYWNVDFTPQSIQFKPHGDDGCGTGPRTLVIGAEMTLPLIPQALHAALGFKTDGNLASPADNVEGCDSRFAVPGQLSLRGPTNSFFPVSTAAEGYFNTWRQDIPTNGFYNLAGSIRVPFFKDVQVHLHVMPSDKSNATVTIMGGWPYPGSQAQPRGWTVNGSSYFNSVTFDLASDGWPVSQVSIAQYENSPSEMYRARAQQDWIEVATFDYSLQWDPGLRQFSGYQDDLVDLPVLAVNSRLKQITPGKVDFDFAQDLSLPLPRIKALDLLNDAIGEGAGPLASIQAVKPSFDVAGLNELQHLLREDPQSFFGPALDSALGPVVTNLFNSFSNYFADPLLADLPSFLSYVASQVNNSADPNSLANAINGLSSPGPSTLAGQVNQTLSDVQSDLGYLTQLLVKDGNWPLIKTLVNRLLADQAGGLSLTISSLPPDTLDTLMNGISPNLDAIQTQFQEYLSDISQFNSALSDLLQNVAQDQQNQLDALAQHASSALQTYYTSALKPGSDYFSADPNGARQAIRQQLRNSFFSSSIPAAYQQALKQLLFDFNASLDQSLDSLFGQLNGAIRDGLSSVSALPDAHDTLEPMKAFENAVQQNPPVLASAKIRGSPTFNGDSLRKIHLDAHVQFNIPDQMDFDAYMEIKELDSQSVPVDCVPAGDPAAEVTLGADNVKLDWLVSSPLTLSADAKWTLHNGNIIGLGGKLDIQGTMGFHGFSLKEIGVDLAFGGTENYFAGKAAGTVPVFGIPVDVQAGLFVGKACSLDPLTFIDPHASDILQGSTGFAGVYIQYGGGLSLSDLFFGSSSCALDAQATESVALFYDGGMGTQKIGMHQSETIDLSLLCLISGSATMNIGASIGSSQCQGNPELKLDGSVQLCGSLGPCPFCISGCKGLGFSGTVTPPCQGNGPRFDFNLNY